MTNQGYDSSSIVVNPFDSLTNYNVAVIGEPTPAMQIINGIVCKVAEGGNVMATQFNGGLNNGPTHTSTVKLDGNSFCDPLMLISQFRQSAAHLTNIQMAIATVLDLFHEFAITSIPTYDLSERLKIALKRELDDMVQESNDFRTATLLNRCRALGGELHAFAQAFTLRYPSVAKPVNPLSYNDAWVVVDSDSMDSGNPLRMVYTTYLAVQAILRAELNRKHMQSILVLERMINGESDKVLEKVGRQARMLNIALIIRSESRLPLWLGDNIPLKLTA